MEYLSCIYCGHANESGRNCDCPENCYCKAPGNTCDPNKNKNSNRSKQLEEFIEKTQEQFKEMPDWEKDPMGLTWHDRNVKCFRKLSSVEDFVLLKNKVKQISLKELNNLYQNFDLEDVILFLNYNDCSRDCDLVISRPETDKEFEERIKKYLENMESKKEKEIKNIKNQIKELEEKIKKIENNE
jgi:predicted ribosome quality control (RQC) complex YloA/Tae2 family protein